MTTATKTDIKPSRAKTTKKSKTRSPHDYHVDPRRPWLIVSDDGEEAGVLMAKNITKLSKTISAVKDIHDNKEAMKTFKQFLDLLDFAPVTIDEKREVRWKQGQFAGRK